MLDRDSAHFAQASRQMLESHHYFQIYFQDQLRNLKPPGIYWLQALSVSLFSSAKSTATWPYRIPNVIFAIFSIIVLFYYTRRQFNKSIAFTTSLLFSISFLLNTEIRQTSTDVVFLFTNLFMLLSLNEIYQAVSIEKKPKDFDVYAFWTLMSLGTCIKGLSCIYAFLIIFCLIILDKEFKIVKQIKIFKGLLILLILTLAWLIPFSYNNHSNFLMDMIKSDLLPKISGGQESHGFPPGYFALLFMVLFWPGSFYFPSILLKIKEFFNTKKYRLFFIWAISIWILVELTPTKLPEYILPAYPASAILLATAIHDKNYLTGYYKIFEFFYKFIWFIISFSFFAILLFASIKYTTNNLWVTLFLYGTSILLLLALLKHQNNNFYSLKILTILSILTYFSIYHLILPHIENLWFPYNLSKFLAEKHIQLSSSNPLIALNYHEPSMVFYLGTKNVLMPTSLNQIKLGTQPTLILIDQERLTLLSHFKSLTLLGEFTAFNYNNGHLDHLVLVLITP